MYDGRIGRWLSVDPAGQFASPYEGMGNNPVSGSDPTGGEYDWYTNNATGELTWFDGNGPIDRWKHLGGDDYLFQATQLAEVTIKGTVDHGWLGTNNREAFSGRNKLLGLTKN